MEALNVFQPFIHFFYIISYHPCMVPFLMNNFHCGIVKHRMWIVRSVVFLLGIIGAGFAVFYNRNRLLYNDDYNGQLLNFSSLMVIYFTLGLGIFEALVTCKDNVEIWFAFRDIEYVLVSGGSKQQLKQRLTRSYWKYFLRYIPAFLFQISMGLLEIVKINDSFPRMQYFLCTYNIPLIFTCFRMAHVGLYLEIVKVYLDEIDFQLFELSQAINYGWLLRNNKFNFYNYQKLCILEKCFEKCSNVFEAINDQFSISICCNCFKVRLLIIEDIYWLIYEIIGGRFQIGMTTSRK